jgi:hypothetical protein
MSLPKSHATVRARVDGHAMVSYARADFATIVTDTMQGPPDDRSYSHDISPLAQSAAMIFTELSPYSHEQRVDDCLYPEQDLSLALGKLIPSRSIQPHTQCGAK